VKTPEMSYSELEPKEVRVGPVRHPEESEIVSSETESIYKFGRDTRSRQGMSEVGGKWPGIFIIESVLISNPEHGPE
jgi:hypothetical protein